MNEAIALGEIAKAHGYTFFATRKPDTYIIQRASPGGQVEIWRGEGFENMLIVLVALLS